MSHREKIAWLQLAAMVLTFGPYFAIVSAGRAAGQDTALAGQLLLFGVFAAADAVIVGVGRLVLRLAGGGDAGLPADERDQTIDLRSTRWAYGVLIAGMIIVGCVMPFSAGGWAIVNAAVLSIVVAELVHYGIVVANYRLQS